MSSKHVALILEDDPQIADMLARHVAAIGHDSRIATTLAELDALLAEGGFCYALLDMQVPAAAGAAPLVDAGKTALERVRKTHPKRNDGGHHLVPALVLTAYSSNHEFVSEMYDLGANGFIPKPFGDRMDVVMKKVKEVLARAGHDDHEACVRLRSTSRESVPAPARAPLGKLAKLPPLERWSDLHLYVVDDVTLMARIGRTHVRRTAIDFGEADEESREPTVQWQMLVDICRADGNWSHRGYGERGALKTKLSRLRTTLKKVFARDDDPFHPYSMAWRPRFWAHHVKDGGDATAWAK
jgi:DNA-binding response OmpR family regulator